MKKLLGIITMFAACVWAQTNVPAVHSNIHKDADGRLYVEMNEERFYEQVAKPDMTLERFVGNPQGTENGISFDFAEGFDGTLYYGFIPYKDARHALPVFFKSTSDIENGKAKIDIKNRLSGRYDMIGWEQSGKGVLGYRVVSSQGDFIYEGVIGFKGNGSFEVDATIIEGPFVNNVSEDGCVISFKTNMPVHAAVEVLGARYENDTPAKKHEIVVAGLKHGTEYEYTVHFGDNSRSYSFKTAPLSGSREPFSFAYTSDSRSGQGGGERDMHGANYYIMRKIAALALQQDAAFMQFSGDLINGYLQSRGQMDLQYANWKRAIEPFTAYFPVYKSMGNHEALTRKFDDGSKYGVTFDRFPYDTESAEKAFADNFVNPQNGPESEDGAWYDPNPDKRDFPAYKENVFYYTYDNVAVVVLNSDYWYAPSRHAIPEIGGGLHGYIMDVQLQWFERTISELEANPAIDHIFVTQHTPFFPNGGHVSDDMWYNGNNDPRPYVGGKPMKKGIIERRDELLDIAVNKSSKVIAILTGDEHNYNRLEVGPQTPIYPKEYPNEKKIKLKRTIYQVNNGAAGAPYYAQEKTPWSSFVSGFTTQNALVFFDIEGKNLNLRVINPVTLEEFDSIKMR